MSCQLFLTALILHLRYTPYLSKFTVKKTYLWVCLRTPFLLAFIYKRKFLLILYCIVYSSYIVFLLVPCNNIQNYLPPTPALSSGPWRSPSRWPSRWPRSEFVTFLKCFFTGLVFSSAAASVIVSDCSHCLFCFVSSKVRRSTFKTFQDLLWDLFYILTCWFFVGSV